MPCIIFEVNIKTDKTLPINHLPHNPQRPSLMSYFFVYYYNYKVLLFEERC